jgi:hypothetical protein
VYPVSPRPVWQCVGTGRRHLLRALCGQRISMVWAGGCVPRGQVLSLGNWHCDVAVYFQQRLYCCLSCGLGVPWGRASVPVPPWEVLDSAVPRVLAVPCWHVRRIVRTVIIHVLRSVLSTSR